MSEPSSAAPARIWKLATLLFALLLTISVAGSVIEHRRADEAAASLETAVQQLEATQAQLTETQSQLMEKQAQLAEINKPELPVTVSFKSSLSGAGLVGVFKNTSVSPLEVAAVFSSPATGGKRAANLVIPANGVKEVGHVEGWPFAAGQHIQLMNNRYRPREYDVPGT
jgi:hypothetical protein